VNAFCHRRGQDGGHRKKPKEKYIVKNFGKEVKIRKKQDEN